MDSNHIYIICVIFPKAALSCNDWAFFFLNLHIFPWFCKDKKKRKTQSNNMLIMWIHSLVDLRILNISWVSSMLLYAGLDTFKIYTNSKVWQYVLVIKTQHNHTCDSDVDSVAPLSLCSLTPVFSTVYWIDSINSAGRPCWCLLNITFWSRFLSTRVPSVSNWTINPLTMKSDSFVFEVLLSVWSDMKQNCIWNQGKGDSVCKEIFRIGIWWRL